ncbi:UV DNA damage repair endonuclease UvsE [Alkalihalobacillus trypoxylicola]|uniref:UV DNA damage endonuclease n=1 Tax=Alkalihalobacillus trypoxylicola TaxID=519424 RepID=A0A161PVM0_9BACI|nr:UV DNA damage repair endonuclease UvsE [Alkalihalobacillus trypoxylicola]KYG25607.1 UV damage endonuclease UvdE [Alkalihalobacillus trypoxylicola]
MEIHFGYVAHALDLWEASPAKTVTFKRYTQLPSHERLEKLHDITEQNLNHTLRILHYNIAHEINLYRLSSSIVPLATHPEVMWDYISPFKEKWLEIGNLIKKHQLLVSFHPNQFTLFTSPREQVTSNAIIDMEYHYQMLEAMEVLDNSFINIHIGGAYGDKTASLERFHKNLQKLPSPIKKQMTLENDDKTYNVAETLSVCQRENIPMILDYHHHMANKMEGNLVDYLEDIFLTWKDSKRRPKVHLSSPKTEREYRSHASNVSLDFIWPFLEMAKTLNQDFDIMIEAKQKNLAMHQLIEELSKIRGIKQTSGGSIHWK